MFDSYVLTLFYRLYSKLKTYYNKSYLSKIEKNITTSINRFAKNSVFIKTICNDKNAKQVKSYKIYEKIVEYIQKIFDFFRNIFNKYSRHSYTVNSIRKLFDSKKNILKTISISILSFVVTLTITHVIARDMSISFIRIGTILLVLSIIVLLNAKNIGNATKDSFFINFIKSIFTIEDEEEISWK